MARGRVREELGYCTGVSVAVPSAVVALIDAEVEAQRRKWKEAGLLGRPPSRSDVVRKILMDWAGWKPSTAKR